MPTYEYECRKCKKQFEIQRGFNEEGGNCCPECGGEGRQIYSPAPLIFKGSGFYITDSRKKDDKATDREQPTKKDDSVKTETKPSTDKPSPKSEATKPPPKAQSNK